jgi:hypothetical protein
VRESEIGLGVGIKDRIPDGKLVSEKWGGGQPSSVVGRRSSVVSSFAQTASVVSRHDREKCYRVERGASSIIPPSSLLHSENSINE